MNNTMIYRSAEAEKRLMEIYENSLHGWPVPYEGLFVETRFGRTFAIASGDPGKEAIVLLHGSGSNALTWGGDVVEYSKRYRVYALDIVGEPGKSSHTRLGWDSVTHNEWLDDVMNGLGIRSCILAGISYGAWIALNNAAHSPGRISRLVLVSGGDASTVRPSYFWKLIFYSLLGHYGRERLKNMFFADVPLPPEAIEFFDICASSFVYRPGFPPVTPDEYLSKLSMPVLYLASARDRILNTNKFGSRLSRFVPRADIRIIEDKGHALVNSASDVLDFLKKESKVDSG